MLEKIFGKIDFPVFIASLIICVGLTIVGIISPDAMNNIVGKINGFITLNFSWWYLLVVAFFIGFLLWCAFSKYGGIKLGRDDEKPEHSFFHWFAMLFNAGIGIGFIFWGVAEPLYHTMQPPVGTPGSAEAVESALRTVVFHWGIHGWATYGVVGLAIAYFSYRLGRPMTIATGLMGLLGEHPEEKFWGKVINALTVFATIFGSATSLGLGVMQIRYGLNLLFGLPVDLTTALGVTTIVAVLYIISAVRGIDKGIKILSDANMYLAFGLLGFLFFLGPTRFILNIFTDTIGQYMTNFVWQTFWSDPVNQTGWLGGWTIFYWAWWIAWAPWVGGFIARISRGRTVKQFVVGTLLIPTMFTIIWFSIVGGAAVHAELFEGVKIWDGVQKATESGIFTLLGAYPFPWFMGIVIIISLVVYFVTGADAASYMIAMIMSKGDLFPKNGMKILWGALMAVVALVLMVGGGLGALQAASIVSAFPFSIAMIAFMWSTVKGFQNDAIIATGRLPEEKTPMPLTKENSV